MRQDYLRVKGGVDAVREGGAP